MTENTETSPNLNEATANTEAETADDTDETRRD